MNSINTVIEFDFIQKKENIKITELMFELKNQEKILKLDENNKCIFTSKIPSEIIYYTEKINVIYNNNVLYSFEYRLSIRKINHIILDLDEVKKPSFEMLFYSKKQQDNPNIIKYKDKEFSKFDSYGNKYRKKIFFANVNPSYLEYMNSPTVINYNIKYKYKTYQALFRMINDKNFEISMADVSSMNNNIPKIEKSKIKIKNEEYNELHSLLNSFYEQYNKHGNIILQKECSIEEKRTKITQLNDISKNISFNHLYNLLDKTDEYEFDYENENNILELFHLDFYLKEYNKLRDKSKELKLNQFQLYKKEIGKINSFEQNIYKKLKTDSSLNLNEKIQVIKTIIIFINKNNLYCTNTILYINYLNIDSLDQNDAYYKSRNLLKNIISGLNEESRLFEAFMYFDSEIIENILIKNEQKNYNYIDNFNNKITVQQPEYITEYGINLMTVDEIKEHLFKLIPKIIIQISTTSKIHSFYENKTKIMGINEIYIFGNDYMENKHSYFDIKPEFKITNNEPFEGESDCYVVPLALEILCEMLANGKIRYGISNDIYSSPLVLRDSKKDFRAKKLIQKLNLEDNSEREMNKGESGRVLEYYISEDSKIIKKLKQKNKNKEINNSKYWTAANFDDLHKVLNPENNEIKNISDFSENIYLDDYDKDDSYECIY